MMSSAISDDRLYCTILDPVSNTSLQYSLLLSGENSAPYCVLVESSTLQLLTTPVLGLKSYNSVPQSLVLPMLPMLYDCETILVLSGLTFSTPTV